MTLFVFIKMTKRQNTLSIAGLYEYKYEKSRKYAALAKFSFICLLTQMDGWLLNDRTQELFF